jgi:hypothetical protein
MGEIPPAASVAYQNSPALSRWAVAGCGESETANPIDYQYIIKNSRK